MEFEIGHLDMIQSESTSPRLESPSIHNANLAAGSLILNELQKETEELQNKLKLNNRRLLLFETENNKLIEEKNKLFFEMQNLFEKNQILTEKNSELETSNSAIMAENDLLTEKLASFEKINSSQLAELKRFSKFHLKIQNVIKPYLQQLKISLAQAKHEIEIANRHTSQLEYHKAEIISQVATDTSRFQQQIASLQADKNATISSYEDQIHSFSKEIVRLEQHGQQHLQEISRLKKSVEFKNYFENELIKFKRVHEDDQQEISSLKDKLNRIDVQLIANEQISTESLAALKSRENQLSTTEHQLEITRDQLAKNIDQVRLMTERLARLEKLNLNLSQQMHPTT